MLSTINNFLILKKNEVAYSYSDSANAFLTNAIQFHTQIGLVDNSFGITQ